MKDLSKKKKVTPSEGVVKVSFLKRLFSDDSLGMGIARAVIFALLSLGVYSIALLATRGMTAYLAREAIALAFSLLFFWAVGLAIGSPTKYKWSVVVFLLLFFAYNVVNDYLSEQKQKMENMELRLNHIKINDSLSKRKLVGFLNAKQQQVESLQRKVNSLQRRERAARAARARKRQAEKRKVVVLKFGGQLFDLKPGETTPWLTFPQNSVFNYTINSSDDKYILIYTDGTTYSGISQDPIPFKQDPIFKIKSVSSKEEFVTITITRG